jgi:hypothetical protein
MVNIPAQFLAPTIFPVLQGGKTIDQNPLHDISAMELRFVRKATGFVV